jgi:hypothetical protein
VCRVREEIIREEFGGIVDDRLREVGVGDRTIRVHCGRKNSRVWCLYNALLALEILCDSSVST